jgi:HSP20 family protein
MIKKENGRQPATFGSVVDQIFQNNLSRFFDDEFWGFNGALNKSQVPVNIRETDNSYEMHLITPGLRKNDFLLNIAGDTLTVSFKHAEEHRQENQPGNWLTQEYKLQEFSRSFSLGDTIDAGKIAAKYEDGILKLQLPKKENAQKVSREITIE